MNELSQITLNSVNRKNSLNADSINKLNKTDRSISVKQLNMKEYFSKILKKPSVIIKYELSERTDRKTVTSYEGFIPQQTKDKKIQNISKNKQDKNLLYEQKSLLNLVDKITNQSKEIQFNGKEEFLTSRSYIPSQIHNETMIRLNKLNVLPSIQTTPLNTTNIDFRNYSNLSSLENHKVNLIDQKIGEKEYYDTPLLSPNKINSIEACRLFKDQTLYQQFTTKGVEYSTDIEHIKKTEKTKILNLLDINQIDISKEDAVKLLQSFQSSANKSNLHLPLHNRHKNVTSRKDVEDLEQWLNYMTLQVLQNKQLDGTSLFQTLQQIFCACLNELIRQVSLQCLERGYLIRRVWESYIGLFSKVKSEESSKIEGQSLAEATRLHKNYQNQINQLSNQLNETQKNYEQAKEKNKRLKFLNQQYGDRVKFFEGQSAIKINEINELKYNLSVLQNENQRIFSYVKEMGIFNDSKMKGNKFQQEFLESFTKSQHMNQQSGIMNQYSIFERADKNHLNKLEFKNNKIKRSVSLTLGDEQYLQENKHIKENEKREQYFRLKSDICISSIKNDISKSDENNKGVDTQELNEFAQQDSQKLNKYIKILKSQLSKSKKKIQTLQQQQQQKEEKVKTSSRSIQNSSHHSKQKSTISESQRHTSKQSVSLQVVCIMCQQKYNEQNDISNYTPKSPNPRKASNFNFNKDSEMNLTNKNSFLEAISPYSEKKEITKRKVSNTSQINSTRSNNMQSLQHIKEEEKDFLNANQDQDSNLKNAVSSQKIKSIIIIDKSSKQISKASIQPAKTFQSITMDKNNKLISQSNQMIKSKTNIQEYEHFLNDFYQEANQYFNLDIKQERENISSIAKILDKISSSNQDTNIKQFLEHFAQARSYLNEKLKEIQAPSIQNSIQVPAIDANLITNSVKQTPKNSKHTKTQKKNLNNTSLNVNKSTPRKSILFTQPNASRSIQQKNQPLQQQQQKLQAQQQSTFRMDSQKLNLEPEEINIIKNEIKRVPSIIEDIEKENIQLEIQKIKNTLELYHQLILDILSHVNIESLPEQLQQRINLWIQQHGNQNISNLLQPIELQLSNSDKNKKMLNQSLVSKSNINFDSINHQNSQKKVKSSYNIEQQQQQKSSHSFNKFGETQSNQNHKSNYLQIISDKELNLVSSDDQLSFSKLQIINFQNNSPSKQGTKTFNSIESPYTNQHKQKQKFFNYDEKKQKRGSALFSQNQLDQYDNFNDYENGGQNVVLYAKKGKKKSDKGAVSINQEVSYKLVQSIVEKQKNSQIKPHMSKLNLIKFISVVYQERIRIAQNYNNMIYTIAYDYLLNKYGLKRVAEKKLSQYLETCYFYQDIPRVKLFGNFMQLFSESERFDKDEYNFYISILKYMDEKTNTGLGLVQTFNERILCSFEKVTEYMQINFESDSHKKNDQILRQIQQTAINVGNQLFVDIDQAFKIIVSLYQNKKEEIENNVKKLFYAADLDKNDCIELDEFITIYRYLESETFKSEEVQHLFINSSDMITIEGEKAFSLDRFAAVCLDYQLFSLQKQQQFSQAFSQLDYVKSIEDLTKNFHKKFREIKARLQFANQYTSYFMAIIDSICQLIQPQNIQDNANKDMLWISYRLLDEESKRLYLEQLQYDLLSSEFHQIQQVYGEIDQNLI